MKKSPMISRTSFSNGIFIRPYLPENSPQFFFWFDFVAEKEKQNVFDRHFLCVINFFSLFLLLTNWLRIGLACDHFYNGKNNYRVYFNNAILMHLSTVKTLTSTEGARLT